MVRDRLLLKFGQKWGLVKRHRKEIFYLFYMLDFFDHICWFFLKQDSESLLEIIC